jgi:hypothetical protein
MPDARCPFEKPILSAQCGCENATRNVVAERMTVGCRSPVAHNNCQLLLEMLKERSRFALKVTDTWQELPFGKQMRVMVGGLTGLQRVLHSDATSRVDNVHALVCEAQERFGTLESLPFDEIVRFVTAFQPKRRRGS